MPRFDAAGEADARTAIGEIANSDMARVVMAILETVFMPAGVAPSALVDELGAQTWIVQVSNSTMRSKVGKHGKGSRGMTLVSFGLIQRILECPRMINQDKPRHLTYFGRLLDGLWSVVVKAAS